MQDRVRYNNELSWEFSPPRRWMDKLCPNYVICQPTLVTYAYITSLQKGASHEANLMGSDFYPNACQERGTLRPRLALNLMLQEKSL